MNRFLIGAVLAIFLVMGMAVVALNGTQGGGVVLTGQVRGALGVLQAQAREENCMGNDGDPGACLNQ